MAFIRRVLGKYWIGARVSAMEWPMPASREASALDEVAKS